MNKLNILGLFLGLFILVSCSNDKAVEVADPMKTEIHVLDNGLTIYMSVNKDMPRVYTSIAVRAGSKDDPADATGLAHYLEHMLFKGTDKFGSLDFAKESALVQQIEDMFEEYRKLTDVEQRKALYKKIDSVSYEASKYAIAQEYDKMVTGLGASGTNAYTSFDQTVYINDIPSNQLNNWLQLEAERFRKPVLRLFHTELEAVYEEKNISLDRDDSKAWESLFSALYPEHPYGQQTTIGTIDHLKNPSMKAIREYYDKNYIPNNMAICLAGDFDPKATLNEIKKYFGGYKQKSFTPTPVPAPYKHNKSTKVEVVGPDKENVRIGFRFDGANTFDSDMLELLSNILFNQTAGLMDINLVQKQKVLSAYAFAFTKKDYTSHIFYGQPKEGQTLEEVEKLMLEQLELIKKGEFEDWLIEAAINDLELANLKSIQNNYGRVGKMVSAFVNQSKWEYEIERYERLRKITKDEIKNFATEKYGDNYVTIYKRTAQDTTIQKVEKPQITPILTNREEKSDFTKNFLTQVEKAPKLSPVFVDYKKDITENKLPNGAPVYSLENKENDFFNLYFLLDFTTKHDLNAPLALEYLEYLGAGKYSAEDLKKEFFKIGCSFYTFNANDETYIAVEGLNKNIDKALELVNLIISEPKADEVVLANLVEDKLKVRKDNKLSKSVILKSGMMNYGKYGAFNPFTNIVPENEMLALKGDDLLSLSKKMFTHPYKVLYYGPSKEDLLTKLSALEVTKNKLVDLPKETDYKALANEETKVFVVDFDMTQAEIMMVSRGNIFNADEYADAEFLNAYFGRGMNSIMFQELRESKALAYSTYAGYGQASKADIHDLVTVYIGTQADKLPEAMTSVYELLSNVPLYESNLEQTKNSIAQRIASDRITKTNVLMSYVSAQKRGIDYDIRKSSYDQVQTLNLDGLKQISEKYLKDRNYNIMVLGRKKDLDLKTLAKYGKIEFLTLEDVFGY
jgi:zinc protease